MRTLRFPSLPSHEILRLRSRMTTWDGASRIKVTIGTGRRDVDPYKFEKHRALFFIGQTPKMCILFVGEAFRLPLYNKVTFVWIGPSGRRSLQVCVALHADF